MNLSRRKFLKVLAIAGIDLSLVPVNTKNVVVEEEPKGDNCFVVAELAPLTNIGISDDDTICGNEESLIAKYNMYALDEKGNKTFLKTLSNEEFRKYNDVV